MVDFRLSNERRQYVQLAKEFAQNEIFPKASYLDQNAQFPAAICQLAFDIGLMNVCVPEEYGGLGLGLFDACLIAEELACACTGVTSAVQSNDFAQVPLLLYGTSEQKMTFLSPMTESLSYAGFSLLSLDALGNLANVKVCARQLGHEYVLNGDSCLFTNASVASWYFLIALADEAGQKPGYSAFLVPAEIPGVIVSTERISIGQRCADLCTVSFKDVCLKDKFLLGGQGDGLDIYLKSLNRLRPLMASWAVGLARSALQHSIAYSKERTTFGQPIANHQAISFMLADMAKDIEAARLLVKESAWLYDQGQANAKEATIAKSFAFDMAMHAAQDAVQIFGGYGYSREYPVEKLMRDAKNLQIYGSTSQIERAIIGRQLVGVI